MPKEQNKEITHDKITFVTQVELAKILGVHRDTISRWSLQGVIPTVKIGKRSVRYDLAKVREFLDNQQNNSNK